MKRHGIHVLAVGALLATMLTCLVACGQMENEERNAVDSLNMLAYQTKYASLDKAKTYVDEIFANYSGGSYKDGLHEAWLNLGDIYGMKMDYDSAQWCYKAVLDESGNDLICSIADVDMMSVCLMTSMNKEFYDYRGDAQERFANIADESGEMDEHQRLLWDAVQVEYHFVSVNYFIKMRQDEGVAEEYAWLDKNKNLYAADTTQISAYMFLKSLYSVKNGNSMDDMQRNLVRLLSMSLQNGNVYFEASALNSLASFMLTNGEMKPSRKVFLEELIGENGDENLVEKLAIRSLRLAERYGNRFVQTMALVTLSDYYLKQGEDSLALEQMESALSLINAHHREANRTTSEEKGTDVLYAYSNVEDTISTEMKWIANPDIVTVPEWMALVREQLSVIYGAMGMKAESDYNHNIYFDILDATRQDQRVQQEEDNLNHEERMLNILLWGFGLAFVALVWILIIYNRRSRKEYHEKVDMLGKVVDICKNLSSALSDEVEDEDGLKAALHEASDADVETLFPQFKGQDWTQGDLTELKGLDRELFHVLLVFYEWMKQKGLQFLEYTKEQRRLESETYVFEKRFEGYKRQYIEKLTSMSIVNGITPFLDRALREVNKLKTEKDMDEGMVRERFLYLSELIDKINEYNDVLGHWVKIRQGMVTLNVESFALQPLFDTLKHGAKTFDIKGVALQVQDTPSMVKADKSLTLFMMNTLLDNARKYTPEGGAVTLSAEETDTYVEVSVKDTGHGMSAEDVNTINNSKVYDSSKIGVAGKNAEDIKQNKGFGFGLMNCKGIIGKYKKTNALFNVCDFGVESKVGEGSRFFFRLPKGVVKAVVSLLMLFTCGNLLAADDLQRASSYADSIFSCNVQGDYQDAILFADSAISCLNAHYQATHPHGKHLMSLAGADMAELEWWKSGVDTDYELIISIRNEVAIAALAINRNALYHYNSEVFTRLYKMTSTDPTLEDYCNNIRIANRNKKTIVILLGILIVFMVSTYFILHYRHYQLFLFNLRQFIQLNNNVFSSTSSELSHVFHQGLSDIKPADTVGVLTTSKSNPDQFQFTFTGDTAEREGYEALMRSAYVQKREVHSRNGHFYAYPLYVPGTDDASLTGVMGVRFSDVKLTAEEELIVHLVAQFMSIHSYFSYQKVAEMDELIEQKQEEHLRVDNEQQRVYVQNQIMDNSLSTLKHETMYYPNRIKQIVDAALNAPDFQITESTISDIDELLSYYKEIFTILSSCAGKQVEKVLFKRTLLSAQTIGEMATRSFQRQRKKQSKGGALKVSTKQGLRVQGDKIFLQTLIDNIISLYFERQSGGDLLLDFDVSDGFAKFAFTDTAYRYNEEEISQLFYVDNVKYDTMSDSLSGVQYLLCRQIIREHDAYSSRRGCRIYVENNEEGQGSRFVFTLPQA